MLTRIGSVSSRCNWSTANTGRGTECDGVVSVRSKTSQCYSESVCIKDKWFGEFLTFTLNIGKL